MNKLSGILLSALALTFALVTTAPAADKTRVLVVYGGHAFNTNEFLQVFEANPNITFQTAGHPNVHKLFKPAEAKNYDVIVFYDMWQPITDEAKADFLNLVKTGKGLVATHHCLASYQAWPEYAKIVGGRYNLPVKGKPAPTDSTYKHDVDFTVKIADAKHPITQGLADFQTHDETYGNFTVNDDVHPLLTTDEPTSTKTIGWCKKVEASRVVYLELGHDKIAFANPNYRKVLAQAIAWAAGKD